MKRCKIESLLSLFVVMGCASSVDDGSGRNATGGTAPTITGGSAGIGGASAIGGTTAAGGDATVRCSAQIQAVLSTVEQSNTCTQDSDCAIYTVKCITNLTRNCGGLYYINVSTTSQLDALQDAMLTCLGVQQCVACGIGLGIPSCNNGVCG